ncbi:sensor histidine kinase [Cellulomonas oligotrophica]|uniref:histidine kinase n=1 Tax=Cellulomonas oligotrophica TaxID=931536 RepID=A0A7Y9JWD3_9CELL|nr:sensor histidine kinase [Cellulomonas oligotrophica]NYD85533.1 signal transduction histidine kinase [Cellulomonas oligotrophica]GIG31458.1 two-component sensor histidine kinase [Cellulomonas oligotrophica]
MGRTRSGQGSAIGAETAPMPVVVPRSRSTVRGRLMAAVVALTATTLAVSAATGLALQLRSTDRAIDESLERAAAALHDLERGRPAGDDEARAPWSSVHTLLATAVQNRVPGEHEGVVSLVDGALHVRASDVTEPLRIDLDTELIAAVQALDPLDPRADEPRTVRTSTTEYRLVALPVTVPAQPDVHGQLVVAFDRSAQVAAVRRIFVTYAGVGLMALGAMTVVAWFVVGRMLRPVRLLRDTARRITESDLSERIEVHGSDDLADLARTVNAMLDRLQRAFGSQRELADDVGHELRTPLTIVRGHLELVDPHDADDVRTTQQLVLDEVDRMQRLVDDLVTLATADRPDFVKPAPCDVGRLTDEVLEKARALGERRFVVVSRADVTALVDAQRITQAWLQLLANAVRYSDPWSTVRLGSEVWDGRLLLWVRDEGPGVPQGEEARIFERFHRGQADRKQHGAGLGLPIVAAIASAHGGRVFLEHPPPGAGTGVVFVLDLPAVGLVDGDRTLDTDLLEHHR